MKLKGIVSVALGVFLLGAPVVAQQTEKTMEKKEEKKVKTDAGTAKSKTHTVVGTVKEFEAGKSIKVSTSPKKSQKFSLDKKDVATTVDPAVAVGTKVKVVESTDASGNKTLTVTPYKKS